MTSEWYLVLEYFLNSLFASTVGVNQFFFLTLLFEVLEVFQKFPGAYIFQRPFLRGLYVRREICI